MYPGHCEERVQSIIKISLYWLKIDMGPVANLFIIPVHFGIWPRFIFDWYFLSWNPGTKIKEPGTSSSFVFLHLLHNISFGRWRETIWLKNRAKEAKLRNKQPNIIHCFYFLSNFNAVFCKIIISMVVDGTLKKLALLFSKRGPNSHVLHIWWLAAVTVPVHCLLF